MARKNKVIYVHGPDFYCHCDDHARCDEVHAEDEGVANDDIAAWFLWHENDKGGNAYYATVEGLLDDLWDLPLVDRFGKPRQRCLHEPGEGIVTDLATGKTYDAAEFRDAHQ